MKLEYSISEWIDNNYENIPKTTKSTLLNVLIKLYNNCEFNNKNNIIEDLITIIKINSEILERGFYKTFKELRNERSGSTINSIACIVKKALIKLGANKDKLIIPTQIKEISESDIYPKIINDLSDDIFIKKFIIDRFNNAKKYIKCKSKNTQKVMINYWVNILKCFNENIEKIDVNNLDLTLENVVNIVKPIIKSKYYIIYLHHLFYKINDEWDIKISDLSIYFDIKEENIKHDDDGDKHFLTVEQQENIWKSCETTLEKLLIAILFTTGLRVGGICNIKRDDVYDKNTKIIKEYGSTIEKGNKKRVFPIYFMVKEPLEKWLEDTNIIETPYLFYNTIDFTKPRSVSFFQNMFKDIAKRAGYTGTEVHIHSARHTVARNLLEGGNSMDQISKFLGHSNPAITAKFYANLSVKETVERMNTSCIGGDNNKFKHIPQLPKFTTEVKEKKKRKSKLSKLGDIEIMGKSANEQQVLDLLNEVRSNKK